MRSSMKECSPASTSPVRRRVHVGWAFIKTESCHAGAESTHVVFIKNMLVSERALDIEPAGTPFLAIMMNSDRLRPERWA